jgi:hypothetical protein
MTLVAGLQHQLGSLARAGCLAAWRRASTRHATDGFGAVVAFTVRGSEGPNEKWGVREGPSSVPLGDQDRQAAGRRLPEPNAVEGLHRREV